jgi:homocysteine S-methyltransferase
MVDMTQMKGIKPLLESKKGVLILDGGLATELESKGADLSGSLWSAKLLQDDPALIKGAHVEYFNAGADITITASYQTSVPTLVEGLSITEQ